MTVDRASSPLRRVVVAISTFRSDEPILALLGRIFADGGSELAAVIVVDSLGNGALRDEIARRGWPVRYENAEVNLGSAGNLARRLELAAEEDADWCFAINHDGSYDRRMVEVLARRAGDLGGVGALYPKRILIDRGNTSFRPIKAVFEMASHDEGDDGASCEDVAWDSSNGALYSLAAIRGGSRVWADLWMGWEDLALGWQLSRDGWKQYRCAEAAYLDDYEYQKVRLLGRELYIARKPAWYAYYLIRNLVLIVRRTGAGAEGWWFLARRLAREIGFTILFRAEKRRRLVMLGRGLLDGLAGRTGKGAVP